MWRWELERWNCRPSIWRRPFRGIDDDDIDRSACGLEAEAELLAQRGEDRRAGWIDDGFGTIGT
jgi:hypothetical protein